MWLTIDELKANDTEIRRTGRVNFAGIKSKQRGKLNCKIAAMAAQRKKKNGKAVAGGREEAPKTTRGCVESERGYEWISSIENEIINWRSNRHGSAATQLRTL